MHPETTTSTSSAESQVKKPFDNNNDKERDGAATTTTTTTPKISTISRQLHFRQVPLPPLPISTLSTTSATTQQQQQQQQEEEEESNTASYANFLNPSLANKKSNNNKYPKYQYPLNYGTHIPDKNLISFVGVNLEGEVLVENTNDTKREKKEEMVLVNVPMEKQSGYSIQVPYVFGTVIGYSPPLEDDGYHDDDNDDDDDDDRVGEGQERYPPFEFEVERQRMEEPLFRILWDGVATTAASSSSCAGADGDTADAPLGAAGYLEDVTLSELLPCLITSPSTADNTTTTTTTTGVGDAITSKPRRSKSTSKKQQNNNENQPLSRNIPLLQSQALSIHKHVHATTIRKQLQLEWKMENDILPKLVTLAALELRKEAAHKVRLEILLERNRLRMASGAGGDVPRRRRNNKKKSDEEIMEEEQRMGGTNSFEYYARHPNQYMPSFQPPPPLPSDDEGGEDDDDGGGDVDNGAAEGRRSRTKLTKNELVTYHEKLQRECHFAPSKLAERVKLACSMAFEYANKKGLLEDYYLESNRRKEREEKAKLMAAAVAGSGGGAASSRGAVLEVGEVRRSSRARTKVNYAEVERNVEDAIMEHERESGLVGSGGGNGEGGSSSSLPREDVSGGPTARFLLDMMGWLPNEDDNKTEEEENVEAEKGEGGAEVNNVKDEQSEQDVKMEDADEPNPETSNGDSKAQNGKSLSEEVISSGGDVAGAGPDSEEEEDDDDDKDVADEEVMDEEEEEEPEVEEGEDPFFEPDHCLIIDQLGRKQRYMSPSDIQAAIVRTIEGEPIETPKALLDEEQVEEMEKSEIEDEIPRHYVTGIECTTDDKISDLPEFEPSSFARCRFAPHTFIPEPEPENDVSIDDMTEEEKQALKIAKAEARAAAKKKKEERRRIRRAAEQKRNAELERIYRSKKAYDLWRFKSIHGNGCAIWPSWSERSRSILKDMFVMSRVNSVEALAGQDSQVAGVDVSTPSDAVDGNGAATNTQNDEALARSLAEAEGTIVNQVNESEPAPKRRRTRRAAGGDEPVFYGSHQSMSRDQLLSTLVRLLRQAKPGSSSVMDLKRLVFSDDYDMSRGGAVEWKKLRSALGHIMFRLGQIGRLTVDIEGDSECWDMLKGGALVNFSGEMPVTGQADPVQSDALTVGSGDGPVTSATTMQTPAIDALTNLKLKALEKYVRRLHFTELTLRSALMKVIDKGGESGETLLQISTVAVATGADETKGDADAADWRYFTNKEKGTEDANNADNGSDDNDGEIKWSSSGHSFIGKVIFRPSYSPLRLPEDSDTNPKEQCQWYEVVSHTPSIKAVEVVNEDPTKTDTSATDADTRPNVIVERRMRFRAVPVARHDAEVPPDESQMDIDDDDDDEMDFMILTEAQVQAGLEAASIQRKILSCRKSTKSNNGDDKPLRGQHHPFRNKIGSRVMMTPQPGDGEEENFAVILGIIAGHDISTDENNLVQDKVLVLLEDPTEEKGDKKSCAIWATVHLEGTLLTDITPDSSENAPPFCSRYKVDMHEYYHGSEAYNVCESIITYLRSHPKSGIFMDPVDPVALGIPDYPEVIKKPMDISTLAKNLEEGKYSRIPPKQLDSMDDEEDENDHPVYKMAYGPFYEDVMLIFDNAVLYNSAESWIGADALLLKKNVIRKIDNAVAKAAWNGPAKSKSTGSSKAKKSIYADDDSDVDMYEYESDQGDDEDFDGGRRRPKKSRGTAKSSGKPRKEDLCSKAIERPYMLPVSSSDFGTGGAFPHLKVQTNVDKFTLFRDDWACRYVEEDECDEDGQEDEEQETDPAEDEMLLLMKLQEQESNSVRRSSRARTATKAYTDDEAPATNNATSSRKSSSIAGVEYYFVNDETLERHHTGGKDEEKLLTSCRTRIGVEGILETLHERFYAKFYRELTSASNGAILGSGLGTYVDGSFPPYLGRVIPEFSSQSDDSGEPITWEIRDQYLIPALRWILRGLVRSGHLEEVDGSLTASASNDFPTTGSTAFGAGVVVPNHEYYYNEIFQPFEVLDEKEILRKRRQETTVEEDSSSEEEVEMSAYERMRAERVARNAERLKALGLG